MLKYVHVVAQLRVYRGMCAKIVVDTGWKTYDLAELEGAETNRERAYEWKTIQRSSLLMTTVNSNYSFFPYRWIIRRISEL